MAGKHLKVISMGSNVKGVKLRGDVDTPEDIHFRVMFPGGDVDIVRTTDNDYWIHVRVDHPEDGGNPERPVQDARITDARLDLKNKATSQVDVGDFNSSELYHLAVRVTREPCQQKRE